MPFATVKGAVSGEVLSGERLKYLRLWDSYGPLLTDTQREFCRLYYQCDLSLSEIAEEKGVSKQSVSDTLKKSRELLDRYEEKLHHSEQNVDYSLKVSLMITEVLSALDKMKQWHPQLADEVDDIIAMLTVGETIEGEEE